MSKLSVFLMCCIFATLSLSVNCRLSGFDPKPSPTSSSSYSVHNDSNHTNSRNETHKNTDNKLQSHVRQKRSRSNSACSRPALALMYPFQNFQARSLTAKTYNSIKDGRCMELPESWLESVNTVDTCVRLYISKGCTGTHAVLEPGTDFHRNVRHLFVSPLHKTGISPRSVGTCS